MNDPHVVAVQYELAFEIDVQYEPPESLVTYPGADFDVQLESRRVRFIPKSHFADRESARAASDQVARAWEVSIGLEVETLGARLRYEKTEVIDRNPTPGFIEVHAEGIACSTAFGTLTVTRSLDRYPQPPDPTFKLTPDADFIWQRYRMFKEGREPLLSMAYFVLTAVESPAGGRKRAASALNVDEYILQKLGELSSTRGDSLSARKHANSSVPLQPNEQAWLQRAIEKLIIQVGRSNSGPPGQRLTIGDLPPL